MSNLRINLDDLLHARTVESERIEFNATWDRRVTGHPVLKTICAFANDLRRHGSVPWDSRSALNATIDDLSETMVREHLRDCDSALLDEPDARTIYRKMDIVRRVNDHEVPRNAGLLFFSRNPARWFPGAKIETSILRTGAGGDILDEKVFDGGLAEQVRGCLGYLRREVVGTRTEKVPNLVRASDRLNYPEDALREVLVNALFHRSYGEDSPHATLVRITSDRIDIRSTPGPVAGIGREQFRRGATPRLVPPRNPRLGELFKEVGLAEKRLTGLGKVYRSMERNGSPPPEFHFDEQRTFFQATLFANPWQTDSSAIRTANELRAVGRADEGLELLDSAWRANRGSLALAEELVRQCVAQGDPDRAEPVVDERLNMDPGLARANVVVPWLEALAADGQRGRTLLFLREYGASLSGREAMGAAIVSRRLRDEDMAAMLFDVAGPAILDDPRALLESAQNKLWLSERAYRAQRTAENRELLNDARVLLQRLLRMDAPARRHAWAWRELARARRWLGEPASAVDEAYARAIELAPDETSFRAEREQMEGPPAVER